MVNDLECRPSTSGRRLASASSYTSRRTHQPDVACRSASFPVASCPRDSQALVRPDQQSARPCHWPAETMPITILNRGQAAQHEQHATYRRTEAESEGCTCGADGGKSLFDPMARGGAPFSGARTGAGGLLRPAVCGLSRGRLLFSTASAPLFRFSAALSDRCSSCTYGSTTMTMKVPTTKSRGKNHVPLLLCRLQSAPAESYSAVEAAWAVARLVPIGCMRACRCTQ